MPWITLTIVFKSAAAALMKQAADAGTAGGPEGILNPWFLAALIALFLQAVAWIFALRRLPLSRAYPFLSLVFGVNLAVAWALFDEAVTAQHMAGVALIIAGVIVMSPRPAPEVPKAEEAPAAEGAA